MLRIRQSCTDTKEYNKLSKVLKQCFVQKGYKEQDIEEINDTIVKTDREVLLKKVEKSVRQNNNMVYVFYYTFGI